MTVFELLRYWRNGLVVVGFALLSWAVVLLGGWGVYLVLRGVL